MQVNATRGGGPPYKSPDWRLQTPTPAGTGDSDSNCISRLRLETELDELDDWELDKLDDWMIGDSDWSLRRGIEHATVPTARWRIYYV